MSRVTLELLDNREMYTFCEAGIRGGVSMISNRHAESDNDHKLVYWDANNLYGWAMSQYLPTSEFKWLDNPENINVTEISDDSEHGAILEVDLEYPADIHDLHADFPVAAENIKITQSMLSKDQMYILESIQRQNMGENFIGPLQELSVKDTKKLAPNLNDKTNYIVHYRNLKMYIQLGLKVSKIHRVLQFKQQPWLKSYIDFNTQQRAQATNTFEKNFFKLMNNSVFGKTMENVRNHRKVDIVHSKCKAEKLIAMPTFKRCTIFRENLVAIERNKSTVKLIKPIYSGMAILDISKTLLYDFHYNFIKVKYPL